MAERLALVRSSQLDLCEAPAKPYRGGIKAIAKDPTEAALIGPFGSYNGHYIRDVSTFYGAIGIGLSVAIRRPSWRLPMLALASAQYALHSVNHLFDIARANPAWAGYFDFFSLLGATALLAWLWRAAALEARA